MKSVMFGAMALASLAVTSLQAQDVIKEPVVFNNEDIVFHQIDEHTWQGNGHLMYNESLLGQ